MTLWYKGLPQGGGNVKKQDINYLTLYDAGDECLEVTGGWIPMTNYGTTGHTHTVTKMQDKVYIKDQGQLRTTNKVDLTGYTKMVALLDANISIHTVIYAVGVYATDRLAANWSDTAKLTYHSKIEMLSTCSKTVHSADLTSSNAYFSMQANDISDGNFYHLFVIKPDNWQIWLTKAGLTASNYASLDAVIADNTALTTLMSSKTAVDYMLLHCTGTVMAAVIRSRAALEVIAGSPYNARIFENQHWNKFLRMVETVPESEKIYLYKNGDECTALTGGWIGKPYTNVSWAGTPTAPVVTKTPDSITATLRNNQSGTLCTTNQIAMSGYSKLKVAVTASSGEYSSIIIHISTNVSSSASFTAQFGVVGINQSINHAVISSDIANITDAEYMQFVFTSETSLTMHKAWLE